MSNITINIEFLVGTDIREAITEAKQKANDLNVAYISFKFNDASFSIGRNADVDKAIKAYENLGKSMHRFICEA